MSEGQCKHLQSEDPTLAATSPAAAGAAPPDPRPMQLGSAKGLKGLAGFTPSRPEPETLTGSRTMQLRYKSEKVLCTRFLQIVCNVNISALDHAQLTFVARSFSFAFTIAHKRTCQGKRKHYDLPKAHGFVIKCNSACVPYKRALNLFLLG